MRRGRFRADRGQRVLWLSRGPIFPQVPVFAARLLARLRRAVPRSHARRRGLWSTPGAPVWASRRHRDDDSSFDSCRTLPPCARPVRGHYRRRAARASVCTAVNASAHCLDAAEHCSAARNALQIRRTDRWAPFLRPDPRHRGEATRAVRSPGDRLSGRPRSTPRRGTMRRIFSATSDQEVSS